MLMPCRNIYRKGLFSNYVTLSCLYGRFRWVISHVQLSYQSSSVNVLRRLTDSRGDMVPEGPPRKRSVQFREVSHGLLYYTDLYTTRTSIPHGLLYYTDFYTTRTSIPHGLLYYTDFYTTRTSIPHGLLYYTDFYTTRSSIPHGLLYYTDFYTTRTSILHGLLYYTDWKLENESVISTNVFTLLT